MRDAGYGAALKPVLIASDGVSIGDLDSFVDEVVRYPGGSPIVKAEGLIRSRLNAGAPLRPTFPRRLGIDVVFGNMLMRQKGCRSIAQLFDYQERFYPDLEEHGISARQALERRLSVRADGLVFNSETYLREFSGMHPTTTAQMRVVPLFAYFDQGDLRESPAEIVSKYRLPSAFALFPSQWWAHKNHTVVLLAWKAMVSRGSDLSLVLTGLPHDYRAPRYGSSLLQLISELGLREHVLPLGELPRQELIALFRAARLVIQPSLYEGGGLPAEEARALGKVIVLADLPLQREANIERAIYFVHDDTESLVAAINRADRTSSGSVSSEGSEEAALSKAQQRAKGIAEGFAHLVETVRSKPRISRRAGDHASY